MIMSSEKIPSIAFSPHPRSGHVLISGGRLQALLPLVLDGGHEADGGGITYSDYLDTIRCAILNHWRSFRVALVRRGANPRTRVERIEIRSEKHGSDYHPARIRAVTSSGVFSFVMNVALTNRGRARLPREFRTLRNLARGQTQGFVPEVYFMCSGRLGSEEEGVARPAMFLAEWLESYHEFHLSRTGQEDSTRLVLWDGDQGYGAVSRSVTAEIFRQAAYILTTYYDVKTFREVSPWHHASGDFVVGRPVGNIRVKLIAARQYAPRVVFKAKSPDNPITALQLFFANLSVRMRLDRIDGIGEVCWAGGHCLDATIRGFLDALHEKARQDPYCRTLPDEFLRSMREMSPSELAELFGLVVAAYDDDAPDVPVIRENLVQHILEVYRAFRDLPYSP